MGQSWTVTDEYSRDEFVRYVAEQVAKGRSVTYEIKPMLRSDQQRKAIEVFCRELAEQLNVGGFDQRKVLAERDAPEIPWSQATVKENLFKPILEAMKGKGSTAKMTTSECDEVHRVLHRWLSERSMPCPAWPSRFGG